MPQIECPVCLKHKNAGDNVVNVSCHVDASHPYSAGMGLKGIVTCERDGHQMPVELRRNRMTSFATEMPARQSDKLRSEVPDGLKEDVEEAERDLFIGAYKSVTSCAAEASSWR